MSDQLDLTELTKRAQRGEKEALDRLAELAVTRLRVYVYRLTLQEDLTQEIVQETLLEMVKILGKLKRSDRFLPWLYGIATNKLRHYYRSEATLRRASANRADMEPSGESREEGLENLLSQELKEIISSAIQKLKTRHRAVLVMRCYDGMSYAEIAESMGTTEFGTRMLFIRAKKALQKQLARNGLGKGALLAVLTLFGKMTAPSEAAAAQISVTAATTNAGLVAGAVGLATGKAALIAVTAGALTVGTAVVGPFGIMPANNSSQNTLMTSFEPEGVAASEGMKKSWYFLPEGKSGPLMIRSQQDNGNESQWIVMQDDQNNYLYDGDTVYINNNRAWSEHVLRLPTDSAAMNEFLTRVEGVESRTKQVLDSGSNLLLSVVENGDRTKIDPNVIHRASVLDEDFFLSDWPTHVKQIDNRDAMHARGWTYFDIKGQIRGKRAVGYGRIPFVYAVSKRIRPWLKLNVGNLVLSDTMFGASVVDQIDPASSMRFRGGSFFSGLSRPWMGFHSLDSIRRDAAQQRVPFETVLSEDRSSAEVRLDCGKIQLVYTIDMNTDVITQIDMFEDDERIGSLTFTYLQDLGQIGRRYTAPSIPRVQNQTTGEVAGLLWLKDLTDGTLLD